MNNINWDQAMQASEAEKKITPFPKITFSNNWNGKLNCHCFSTIRIANAQKYVIGNEYLITLTKPVEIPVCDGIIASITPFRLDKLTEGMARLDTGYGVEECRNIMRSMYGEKAGDYMYFFIIIQSRLRFNWIELDSTKLADRKLSGI